MKIEITMEKTMRIAMEFDATEKQIEDLRSCSNRPPARSATWLKHGVLLPPALKQLPSDSEAAERKNLKTEKLIFDNFFGQMSEANEYPFPSKGRFSKTQCFQCFEGCQNQILSPQKR